MDSQKKNDIAYKRNENNDSIESEEETIDLHILQEQKIKKKKEKSLLKKRYSKKKIQNINRTYPKGEFNKFKDKGNYIRTENKINLNPEISIEYQNLNKKYQNIKGEFDSEIQKMKDLNSLFLH